MSTLFGVPVDAVYHIVFALTSVLTPVLGGLAAVVGIVVCTVAVRLLVTPLTFRALRGQAAQARLAPELQRLRQQYAKQPDRLQRELTALYQREGTSMFAGFAPLLVQWPVFTVLYLLFRSPTVGGAPNRLLSRDLLGVPLGSHWLSGAGALSAHGAVFLGVLAVLAAACWLAARSARRVLPQTALANPAAGGAASSPQALTAVTKVLPYLTVVIAVFAPLAGAIYLVTSTGWSAAERHVFTARTGGPAENRQETQAPRASRAAGNRQETHARRASRAAETPREANADTTDRSASSRPGPAEQRKTSPKPTRAGAAGQRKPSAN
jgi:YidC/Oxa1 family membrane protein insertase